MIKRFLVALVAMMILNVSICAAAELVIFHTNDMHSRIKVTDDRGNSIGIAQIAAAVKEVKSKNPATLFLDAGDTLHGMPMITISKGENMVPLLNAAGYDAMTAGNHDFNYGSAHLESLAKKLKFPLLDANIVRKSSGKNVFKPYKIFKLNGIKVGVFGLSTPETAYKTNPANVSTLEFLNPVESAQMMIKILRPKCDVVIALVHLGVDASSEFTGERLARETDGIDLIVDGHSHTALYEGIRINDTLVVQAGSYGHFLGRATLELDA
ncbi:MAG: metallophosphatase, partial [Selenomonadaceae bacterium]|nr:metallophosphatase [Selenomonadaceae bacterium]